MVAGARNYSLAGLAPKAAAKRVITVFPGSGPDLIRQQGEGTQTTICHHVRSFHSWRHQGFGERHPPYDPSLIHGDDEFLNLLHEAQS